MIDQEALEKLRGDGRARAEAVRHLYRRYAPRFFAYFVRHRLSHRDAEALVQNVFVAAVRRCDAYFGDARADAWLWGIARTILLDHFRSRRPEEIPDDHAFERLVEQPDDAAVVPPPTAGQSEADCARAAYTAFAAAHADRAEMLSRMAFDGWSIDDLAVALSRAPGAARAYLVESRAKLKEALQPCHEPGAR